MDARGKKEEMEKEGEIELTIKKAVLYHPSNNIKI